MSINNSVCKVLETYATPREMLSVKLDANENPHDCFEIFSGEFIREIQKVSINRYPCTDSDELRELLAENFKVDKDNIICGNGSDELIQMIVNAFIKQNDNVVIHTPTFSMYKVFTSIAGGCTIEVPPNENFVVNEDDIIESSQKAKAKVIFLCNPNNPTGFSFSREAIVKIIESTDAYVVVDEAYYEFLDETVIDLIRFYDRLIVLRTMSKAQALAGARIGYAIGCKKTMEAVYKVKTPYNLNIFSQLIGKLYLKNSTMIKENIEKIKLQRSFLEDQLKKFTNIKVYNSKGNFILIKTKRCNELLERFKKAGISLRNYEDTPLLKDCIRISIGTEVENRKILELLRKVVG